MNEIRDMWRKGGKAEKAGLVLACIIASAWGIYVILHIWEGILGLVVLLIVAGVVGLIYVMLLMIGVAVVKGAIKGIVNEIKQFMKDLKR